VELGLRGGGESDSGASSAGTLEVGDDRWGPPVIGCARGRRGGGLAAVVSWANRPTGPAHASWRLGWLAQVGCAGWSGWAGLRKRECWVVWPDGMDREKG
jgi:hypothetical protein